MRVWAALQAPLMVHEGEQSSPSIGGLFARRAAAGRTLSVLLHIPLRRTDASYQRQTLLSVAPIAAVLRSVAVGAQAVATFRLR